MEPGDLIGAMQRRWWLLLIGAVLVGGATFIASSRLPKVYESETVLLVEIAPLSAGDSYGSILAAERIAQTYSELIVRRDSLQGVIDSLGLPLTPEALEGKIRTRVPADSRFIHVSVRDRDPSTATAIANELPVVFQNHLAEVESLRPTEDLTNLRIQTSRLRGQIAETEAAIEALESQPVVVPEEFRREELARMREELRQSQATYASLLDSYVQLQLLDPSSGAISIVQPADSLPRVVSPNLPLNTSVGALAGLLLAFGVAIVGERAFPRIASRLDIARSLAVPFLGGVPRPKGDLLEPVSVLFPGSLAAQRYGQMLREVQRHYLGNPGGVLLATAPSSPRHGNNLALNLGALLASEHTKVVVVDANVRAPRLQRLLRLQGEQGLSDLPRLGESAVSRLLQRTSIRGLQAITAGASQKRPAMDAESATATIARVLPRLKQEANVVIVDAPPVTEKNGVAALAAQVDGVILVVEAGETSADAARHAKDTLTRAGARVIGVAMTAGDASEDADGRPS